jgi:hypothetical protein
VRRALASGVLLGVLALASSSASAGPAARPIQAKLKLMPLPQSAYGTAAASLPVDSNSGWKTNKESAESDFDPQMTARKLTRMGRIAGFEVEFDDLTKASRNGALVDADSAVELFRSARDAAAYSASQLAKFRRLEGKPVRNGVVVDRVTYFAVPEIHGARGVRFRLRLGGLTIWDTGVDFPVGVLVGTVSFARADARDARPEARRLAAALEHRIRGALAGTVHDKPLRQSFPKLGGLGPPPGGPSLSEMAIRPIDLAGHPKPMSQRYVSNRDDVSKYVRDYGSVQFGSSLLTSLEATVELLPTESDAKGVLAAERSVWRGAQGRKFLRKLLFSGVPPDRQRDIRVGAVVPMKFAAGDEAFAFRASFKVLSVHRRVQLAICSVRRGQIVETLTLFSTPNEPIARIDIVRLARTAAARIDEGLH